MSSKAVLSQGAALRIGTQGDTPTFTDIEGIQSITSPTFAKDEVEVTDLKSQGKEFISGLGDGGELSFDLLSEPGATTGTLAAGQEALRAAYEDGGTFPFQLVWPDEFGIMETFDAFVRQFSGNFQQNDATRISVVLRVTGKPVMSAAA